MEEKGKKKVKGQKGGWRIGEALLNNHFFEKIVLGEACELKTRVSKPLVRKLSFGVETIPPWLIIGEAIQAFHLQRIGT
jgi:hypothetical protein